MENDCSSAFLTPLAWAPGSQNSNFDNVKCCCSANHKERGQQLKGNDSKATRKGADTVSRTVWFGSNTLDICNQALQPAQQLWGLCCWHPSGKMWHIPLTIDQPHSR
eukprot:scaffold10821_cov199-Amphora_coffeaeformis.AAC.17